MKEQRERFGKASFFSSRARASELKEKNELMVLSVLKPGTGPYRLLLGPNQVISLYTTQHNDF